MKEVQRPECQNKKRLFCSGSVSLIFSNTDLCFFSNRFQKSMNYLWTKLEKSIRSARKGE